MKLYPQCTVYSVQCTVLKVEKTGNKDGGTMDNRQPNPKQNVQNLY